VYFFNQKSGYGHAVRRLADGNTLSRQAHSELQLATYHSIVYLSLSNKANSPGLSEGDS